MKITTRKGYEFFHDMLKSKKLIPRFFCINEKCDRSILPEDTKPKYRVIIDNAYLILKGIKGIIEFDLINIKVEVELIRNLVRELMDSLKDTGNYIPLGDSGFFDKEGLLVFKYIPRKHKNETSSACIKYSDTDTYNHFLAFNASKVDTSTLYESMIGINNKTEFINRDYLLNNYIAKEPNFEIDGYHCEPNDPVVTLRIRLYHKLSNSKNWDYNLYVYTNGKSSVDHKSDLKLIMKTFKNEIDEARKTVIKEFNKLISGGKNDNNT